MKQKVQAIRLKTCDLEQTLCIITGTVLVSYDHDAGWVLIALAILSIIALNEKKKNNKNKD